MRQPIEDDIDILKRMKELHIGEEKKNCQDSLGLAGVKEGAAPQWSIKCQKGK